MPDFRVAWQTFVGLLTSDTLLTGTQPSLEDEGGNGIRRRGRVSPGMLAVLRARAARRVVPRYLAPVKPPTVARAVAVPDERDEADEIAALRMLNLL